tara:strand:- start:137 stop:520 length:384 start_codon:yes stop_codon:yes gene_type:complete
MFLYITKTLKMKKALKYFIKLLFVIILPLFVSVIGVSSLLNNFAQECPPFTVGEVSFIIMLCIGTLFNACIYIVVMSKTKLLPDISFEFMPIVGLAVAYDFKRKDPVMGIVIPFCVIELRTPRRVKN